MKDTSQMKIEKTNSGNIAVYHKGTKMADIWGVMDRMAEAMMHACFGMVVHESDLPEGFLDLKSGVAGEILQKFSNYRMKIGIVGDFRNVTSHALQCFIAESNRGRSVFFCETPESCIEALQNAC